MEKSQMFEKNPKNGMNLIFLNLLETYDKNHNLYIESLTSSKSQLSKRIYQINSVISLGKQALEQTIDFYICEFQKKIEKIKNFSEKINTTDDFESFLQLDVSGENLKLLALNKFIQDQTNLIEKIKNCESVQKLGLNIYNYADYNNTNINSYFKSLKNCSDENNQLKKFVKEFPIVDNAQKNQLDASDNLLQKFNEDEKKCFYYLNSKKEDSKCNNNKITNSPSRYKKKFPSFTQKQAKISNKNLSSLQNIIVNKNDNNENDKTFKDIFEFDNIFNTEIIQNIEEFSKSMNKECKLLNQKRFKDDSLIDNQKDFACKKKICNEENVIKKKEYEEDLKSKIKVLSESSKSATVK